jgi:citrate lyase subunit beta/citryl-CoA lyase
MMFVPVNVDKFVDGAHARGADAIILDLEDSLPEYLWAACVMRLKSEGIAGPMPAPCQEGSSRKYDAPSLPTLSLCSMR